MTKAELEAKKKDIQNKIDNSTSVAEMDRLHREYIEVCNQLESLRLRKK